MKNSRRHLVALVAFAFFSSAHAEDDSLDARIARVEHGLVPPARLAGAPATSWTITSRLAAHRVPAVSLAVVDRGELTWARAYGIARTDEGTPATTETLFQAASISKAVTGVAALTLVHDGHLSLDGDVNEKLTSWKIPASPAVSDQPITLRQLLSHTAGLTVPSFPGYAADAPLPSLRQVLDGAPPANTAPIRRQFPPLTRWQYSGGGYCVVQQLLIDVSGQDFPTLLHDRVLAPAGMTASTFAQPLSESLTARAASGHGDDGSPVPGGAHVYPELAAAGLWTTPTDLARFTLALGHALRGAPGFLDRAYAEAMITPPLPDSRYGLGLGVTGSGDRLQLNHGGGNLGFRCMLVYYPRLDRGAVVMTNGDNGNELVGELLRAVAREYDWPDYRVVEKSAVPFAPAAFDAFAGRYEREDGVLLFTRKETRFYVRGTHRPRTEIFPRSDREFFTLEGDETFSFERDADGNVTHVLLRSGQPLIFRRVR